MLQLLSLSATWIALHQEDLCGCLEGYEEMKNKKLSRKVLKKLQAISWGSWVGFPFIEKEKQLIMQNVCNFLLGTDQLQQKPGLILEC